MEHRQFNWKDCGPDWPCGDYLVEISTLEIARQVLGPRTSKAREARSAVYWAQKQIRSRGRLRLGMHDRGEEFVFANGRLHAADMAGIANHLPMHVRIIRRKHLHLKAGEVFDVTASHTWWPDLHFREELYVFMHVDELTAEPGAKIRVRGNVFIFRCGALSTVGPAQKAKDDTPQFEVQVLGTDHPAYSESRCHPAINGHAGEDGISGVSVPLSQPKPTIFGPQDQNKANEVRADNGTDGMNGGDGTPGQNGGLLMLTDLQIDAMRGFGTGGLRIYGQAGSGRPGGSGGHGGHGGHGGDAPLYPGRGGDGGMGGNGGHGGNGGLAGHIFVDLPESHHDSVEICAMDSLGGAPGPGGQGGKGGVGGVKLTDPDQARAGSGRNGAHGTPGRPGRGRPGPQIHLLKQHSNHQTPAVRSATEAVVMTSHGAS